MPLSDTLSFIEELTKKGPGHASPTHEVYDLIAPLSPYLLKVPIGYFQRSGLRKLFSSTSLTPVTYGLEKNFGQPVLMGRSGISVLPRVGETSLLDEYLRCTKRTPDEEYFTRRDRSQYTVLRKIVELPPISLDMLVQDFSYLCGKKMPVDPDWRNIMFTPNQHQKLRWIDVVDKNVLRALGDLRYRKPLLECFRDPYPSGMSQYSKELVSHSRKIIAQVAELFDKHHVPMEPEGKNTFWANRKIAVATPIPGMKPLKLSSIKPEAMRERLDSIVNHLNINER
jgi:hypothetical protein